MQMNSVAIKENYLLATELSESDRIILCGVTLTELKALGKNLAPRSFSFTSS